MFRKIAHGGVDMLTPKTSWTEFLNSRFSKAHDSTTPFKLNIRLLMSRARLIAGKEDNSKLTFSTKQYTVDIFGREKFTNFQIPSIRFYFPANRFHEAWYFHTISQNSRHTVRFVQLSDQGKAESHMTPILRAVEQIRKLEPEVILLYSNKQNIELILQQVKVPVLDSLLAVRFYRRFVVYLFSLVRWH